MIILLAIIITVFLLYHLVPKGYVLYECLRFPAWTYRMRRFKATELQAEKHTFGQHARQYLVHYRPNGKQQLKEQVVVYVHGGGWQFGKPEIFRPNAQLLDQMGYHSFFLSHRRLPRHNIEDMKADIAAGMKKVTELMKAEKIASKKIILGGVSSGSNLAALFYFDRSMWSAAELDAQRFAGLMLLAAPLDLSKMWPSPTLKWLAGSRKEEMFRKASPVNFVNQREELPILMVHPEKDGMVPLRSTEHFLIKAREYKFEKLEYHVLPSMSHMDAASWCFREHPCHHLVVRWLDKLS